MGELKGHSVSSELIGRPPHVPIFILHIILTATGNGLAASQWAALTTTPANQMKAFDTFASADICSFTAPDMSVRGSAADEPAWVS